MDAEKVAFWGIVLKPGEPADLDLDDGETLRVTTASYGEELGDSSGRSVITASIRPEDDSPSRKYAVAVLTAGKTETVTMDVAFVGEANVTFEVTGKNSVHLVGNFTFENDLDDEDSEEDDEANHLIGLYEDTMESDSEEEAEQGNLKAILEKDKPIITELPNEDEAEASEDDEEEEEPPTKTETAPVVSKKKKGKKGKMPNGDSAGPTKKVSNVSAEPISKPAKQDSGKALDGNEKGGTEEGETTPNVGSQKKSGKHKKKKSGSRKEVDGDAEQAGLSKVENDVDQGDETGENGPGKKAGQAIADSVGQKGLETPESGAHGNGKRVEGEEKSTQENDVMPSSKKGRKRRRKHHVTVNAPQQAPTPPSTKKTKVSERVATPAPSKMSKQVAPSSEPSSQPNGKAEAHGASEANQSELKTPSTDAPSSKKRKRGKKKKDA